MEKLVTGLTKGQSACLSVYVLSVSLFVSVYDVYCARSLLTMRRHKVDVLHD